MDDLISRQDATEALMMMQGIVAEKGVRKGISLAWQQIKDLPPAEREHDTGLYVDGYNDGYKDGSNDERSKVIRCKDCTRNYSLEPNRPRCDFLDALLTNDDYCSKAERRTDE